MVSKKFNTALKIVFGIAFAAAVFAAGQSIYLSAGTYTHAAMGKEFVKYMGFPKADNFSYAGPAAWDRSSWLFDVFIYAAVFTAGISGLSYLKFLMLGIFSCLIFFTMHRKQQGKYISATIPVGLAALWALNGYFRITPVFFSCVFTAYFVFVLEREPEKKNDIYYYTLPLIELLWANTSATAAAGAALSLFYLIYYLVDALQVPEKREKYASPAIVIGTAGVIGASFLSPALFGPYTAIPAGLNNGFISWSSAFAGGSGAEKTGMMIFFIYTAAVIGILFFNEKGADPGRKTGLIKDLLVILGLLALSYSNMDYTAVFMTATAPILMYYAYLIFRWNIVWTGQWTEKRLLKAENIIYIILIPLVFSYAASAFFGAKAEVYPRGASAFLKSGAVPANIYVPEEWAGFAEYNMYPSYRVMWDGNPGRDARLAKEYRDIAGVSGDITPLLVKYGINSFLVPQSSPLAGKLNDMGFKAVYFDDASVIFVNPAQTQDYFKYIKPGQEPVFYDAKNYQASLDELSTFAVKHPSAGAHLLLARLYAVSDRKKAKAYLEDTINNFENEYPLYDMLGRLYYEDGESSNAIEIWEQAKELDPGTTRLMKAVKNRMEKEE
jgi:hypothetical protein